MISSDFFAKIYVVSKLCFRVLFLGICEIYIDSFRLDISLLIYVPHVIIIRMWTRSHVILEARWPPSFELLVPGSLALFLIYRAITAFASEVSSHNLLFQNSILFVAISSRRTKWANFSTTTWSHFLFIKISYQYFISYFTNS